MPEYKSDAEALIDFVTGNYGTTRIADTDYAHILAIPDDVDLRDMTSMVDGARLVPLRKSGSTTLHSVDSFIDYVRRHEGDGTLVFADERTLSLTAVFDHHHAGGGSPGFGRFRAAYAMPRSEEWMVWLDKNDTQMSQAEFAFFLEDRILDIVQSGAEDFPDRVKGAIAELNATIAGPSRMMELSRGLSVFSKGEATAKVDVSSGESTIRFEDGHTDASGKPIKVPNLFVILIPIARHGASYQIPVRLRYRVKDGHVIWWYSIWRPDVFVRDAFDDIRSKVVGEGGVNSPMLDGEASQEAPAR